MKAALEHYLRGRRCVIIGTFVYFLSSRTCLVLILSLAFLPALAWPQTQLSAVSGVITDKSGAVIFQARVVIVNEGTGLERSTITDTAGTYRFSGLLAGAYTIRVEDQGFQTQVREGVSLVSASESAVNFSLIVGDIRQQVTVIANPTGIDSTTSTVSGLVGEQSLTKLPLNNRDLFSAVALEPGVVPNPNSAPSLLSNGKVGQVSIGGTRPSMTNVLIDGMDATDPVFGFSPAGASGYFLGLNELKEVNVLTQDFNVGYGGHGFAVIDMTTKSGTNQFHGSMWELHRDASLDARNYFDLSGNPNPPFVRNQFGAGMGGPLKHDRTFFFVNYEGFREVQASTAIATAPDALAHQGLLPSPADPAACTSATPGGCVAIPVDPLIEPFLNLVPPSNGLDNGDGTGELITANKGATREDHGMVRIDYNLSNTHSLFARYTIDDSFARVPYIGTPPGTFDPGFPAFHQGRNQYFTIQDRSNFGNDWINELGFGINRTTASTSIDNTHPGLSTSLLPDRPMGTIEITGMSLLGNSATFPVGDFSTVYQVQDQMSRTIGRHTLNFGAEFRRLQSNGTLDFTVNGLYTFEDLTPLGYQAFSDNPALEFFLKGLPVSYVGANPSNADSERGYRQTIASGFAQDLLRLNSRLSLNAGLRYDFYSNPAEASGRLSAIRNLATDSAPTVGRVFDGTPLDLLSPQTGFAWDVFGDGKTLLRSAFGIYRDDLSVIMYGADRFLPPFFEMDSFVLPEFLDPQKAAAVQVLDPISVAYYPKFPYAMQYNLTLEREMAPGTTFTVGYLGARGNHLTRSAEGNPFEPALGHRYNPNLNSPVLTILTDGQSFYNSFQASVSGRNGQNLLWQASYTLAHSVDDASVDLSVESVNDPPGSQNIFDRKGSRGPSEFDIRNNFVADLAYLLPGRGPLRGGWEVSAVASVHSGPPFTPMLDFDNADLQSLITPERPNLIGNPYTGICPDRARVGTPSCWFNPAAFAVPPPGQFGNAGRNMLRGPGFAQFDPAIRKDFAITERKKITVGVEAYNVFNRPNFSVPSNTQSALSLGGNGDAVFKDAAGDLAPNVARILNTAGAPRQIELNARFAF